ncbi:plasmid stabilization protein [Scytonema hofmannii PCC 7110]|uniref:Toxin n=1 Tax=Scytonema hofmannii PCC 7110 TaxID=128403 RepID=A0A139XBG8_9CYAN|nr:type II toxin-antitoxin system RelE/ParE family toxin [Scytonema hofmannii]KYC41996.1 plasmid stabilization protein [Scytonema hofmannii PCC 7110]
MSWYRISTQAMQDLENIWNYVAEYSPQAADNLFDKLREKFPKVAKFPQMGQQRFNLAPSLRSFPVGSYLIFYRPIDQGIEIVRILRGTQNIEQIFGEVEDTEQES